MKYLSLLLYFAFIPAHSTTNELCSTTLSKTKNHEVYGHEIPLHFLERIPENEEGAIKEAIEIFTEFYSKTYLDKGQKPERGVHPKTHGSVIGTLVVSKDIAKHDQVGIFKNPGREYEARIRFSNADPLSGADDSIPDSRGFGLKVMGVEGTPLIPGLPGLEEGMSQEFTFNSSDRFFADSARTYADFMRIGFLETSTFKEAAKQHTLSVLKSFRPLLGTRILRAFKEIQNVEATTPLGINYFSISAFQHGEGSAAPIVKHIIQPCEGTWTDLNTTGPNFLRANLANHLSTQGACFKFMIQDYVGGFSVEDLTKRWDEADSPYREVARIYIPPQELLPDSIGNRWVIHPWNTLEEHKPVGGINRLRLAAYLHSIEMRRSLKR